jgi:hypothetical protein
MVSLCCAQLTYAVALHTLGSTWSWLALGKPCSGLWPRPTRLSELCMPWPMPRCPTTDESPVNSAGEAAAAVVLSPCTCAVDSHASQHADHHRDWLYIAAPLGTLDPYQVHSLTCLKADLHLAQVCKVRRRNAAATAAAEAAAPRVAMWQHGR